ncbi:hypothetical protein TNCV_3734941 [Trichonephila clavipes]|nr:hypothetical protein TNCV_3734941 [Trichonephila clavipes]
MSVEESNPESQEYKNWNILITWCSTHEKEMSSYSESSQEMRHGCSTYDNHVYFYDMEAFQFSFEELRIQYDSASQNFNMYDPIFNRNFHCARLHTNTMN